MVHRSVRALTEENSNRKPKMLLDMSLEEYRILKRDLKTLKTILKMENNLLIEKTHCVGAVVTHKVALQSHQVKFNRETLVTWRVSQIPMLDQTVLPTQ